MRLTSAVLLFIFCLLVPSTTLAQYVQYGGVTTTQLSKPALIEKKVLNPQNNQFVDNLNIEQQTFLPDQEVIFRVIVTNITQSDLKNISVSDKLPDVINFVSTTFGTFDTQSKTINLTIDNLKVGESKAFEIKTKVKPVSELPNNITCQTNVAQIVISNNTDSDTATFCVSKQVLGVTSELPKTGPTQTLLTLILSALFFVIGLLMKRIMILERR